MTFNAGAGVITLTTGTNDFTGAVSLSNTGANAVQITDANTLTLGAGTVSGTLTVSAVSGVTVSGDVVTAGTVSVNADSDADGTGTFAVADGVGLNSGNANAAVTITAGDVNLNATGTVKSGTQDLTLKPADVAGTIGLSGGSGSFNVSAAELANLGSSGTVVVGQATGTGAINIGAMDLTSRTYAFSLLSNGSAVVTLDGNILNDSRAISLNGDIRVNAASVTLDTEAGNDGAGGPVTLSGRVSATVATYDLVIDAGTTAPAAAGGAITLSAFGNAGGATFTVRDLTLRTKGGNAHGALTSASALVVSRTTTVDIGSTTSITMTNGGNNFGTLVISSAAGGTIADLDAIVLGACSLGTGTFDLGAVGITQSGAFIQAPAAGAVSLTAGAASITLSNGSNAFTGALTIVSSASATINTNAALTLSASGTLTGPLAVVATGAGSLVTAAGNLTVSGGNTISLTAVGVTVDTGVTVTGPAGITLNAGIGTLTLSGTASLSSTASAIDLIADLVSISGGSSIAATTGPVRLSSADIARAITLGNGASGLGWSNAALNRIVTSGTLTIGDSAHTGSIATDNAVSLIGPAGPVQLLTKGGAITLDDNFATKSNAAANPPTIR